jgi:hypothetical protein
MLTTLEKVKQFGQIEEFESDLLLLRMIRSASEAIEKYCSRRFESVSLVEVRDGTGTRKMVMRHIPVTAVASVTINGQVIPPRPSAMGYGYTFDDLAIKLTGYTFTEGSDNVQVAYTAGLVDVPADVDLACCEMVVLKYKGRDRMGVSSKTIAGESISFRDDDMPESIKARLNEYVVVTL